jgi:DNA polymerase-3 subunit delta
MFIFLYGEDTYRLKQKLKEIVAYYQKVHRSGLNLKFYDAVAVDFQDFKDAFQQTPMFQEKKLIVVENVFSNRPFKEQLEKEKERLKELQDVIIIVYQEGEIKENDKLAEFLKRGKFQRFDLMDNRALKSWLREEFAKRNADTENGVIEKLIEFVGNDLWRMSNEVEKLTNYKKSKGRRILIKDVELLVKPKIELNIFQAIEALARKEKNKALELMEKHLSAGESPIYLLSMINYQFRNLLLLGSKSQKQRRVTYTEMMKLSKELGMPLFAVKKSLALMRSFSFEELRKVYQKIFQTDLDIKTGKVLPEEGLKMLVLDI